MMQGPLLKFAVPAGLLLCCSPCAAQVFMTEEQALKAVFGEGFQVEREQKSISEIDRRTLAAASGLRFPEPAVTFMVGRNTGQIIGYALVMNEIGKSEPITFMVVMSPDQRVTDVHLMVFRESRGAEVREQRFLRQFRGKRIKDAIQVNNDIINYSGATLSSKAISRGVKRALLLLKHFYSPEHPAEASRSAIPPNLHNALPVFGEPDLYKQMRYVMGTFCEIRIHARSAAAAVLKMDAAFAELRRIENVFSFYLPQSELSRINRDAADKAVIASGEFIELLRIALTYSAESDGLFDITAGSYPEGLTGPGWRSLQLDKRDRAIRILRSGVRMDFGGLCKGYAVERAIVRLKRDGAAGGVVNLGGSSVGTFGGRSWLVGIADPSLPKRFAMLLRVPGEYAVTTSGTYERGNHVMNPITGRAVAGPKSATVVTRSAIYGEYLAKRLLLTGSVGNRPRRKADWVWLSESDSVDLKAFGELRRARLLELS